jgi:uncharacterized protein with FMN-binding domain
MAKKMSKRLIALSSGIVATIYLLGYTLTRNPRTIAPGSQLQCAASDTRPAITTSVAGQRARYRDGIYCGVGQSEFGDVKVQVIIRNGRISRVSITQISTFFSESWIDGLPAQVVSRQNAEIDFVTGATGSSQAFQGAIQNALLQAQ